MMFTLEIKFAPEQGILCLKDKTVCRAEDRAKVRYPRWSFPARQRKERDEQSF
jgi:hypothetical protein